MKQSYTPPAVLDDAHLADLVELKAIAAGTETEAYTWPRLIHRLDEMIQARRTDVCAQTPREPSAT